MQKMKIALTTLAISAAVVAVIANGCASRKGTAACGATVTIQPGKAFPWHKGTTMEATQPATIVLPGDILSDGTALCDLIIASDDEMEIGFAPQSDGPA